MVGSTQQSTLSSIQDSFVCWGSILLLFLFIYIPHFVRISLLWLLLNLFAIGKLVMLELVWCGIFNLIRHRFFLSHAHPTKKKMVDSIKSVGSLAAWPGRDWPMWLPLLLIRIEGESESVALQFALLFYIFFFFHFSFFLLLLWLLFQTIRKLRNAKWKTHTFGSELVFCKCNLSRMNDNVQSGW